MSEHCQTCGIVTRGGACSQIDSRRQRLEEEAICPNADHETQRFAREELMRLLGWKD